MGSRPAGSVVLVRFSFSDLSQSKLRPALVLATVAHGDLVLSRITSMPYGDPLANGIADSDFRDGTLRRHSFVRPGKLFTASDTLIVATAGSLAAEKHREVVQTIVGLPNGGLQPRRP